MPTGWYKSLWWFVSNPLYKLDIAKDYKDLPLLHKKNVYIMQPFVDNGFKGVDLKALKNFWQIHSSHHSYQCFNCQQ